MNITPPSLAATSLSRAASFPDGSSASRLIAKHTPQDAATDRTPAKPADQVYQAAQSLIAITLVQPMLAQARQDPFRTDLFHGGFAEDAFGAKLDAIIAERITQKTNLPIVASVYSRIMNQGQQPHSPQYTQPPQHIDTHG